MIKSCFGNYKKSLVNKRHSFIFVMQILLMHFVTNEENLPKFLCEKYVKPIKSHEEFLLSLTHAMVEKVLFLDQIFKLGILMDLHSLRSTDFKNHILSI